MHLPALCCSSLLLLWPGGDKGWYASNPLTIGCKLDHQSGLELLSQIGMELLWQTKITEDSFSESSGYRGGGGINERNHVLPAGEVI